MRVIEAAEVPFDDADYPCTAEEFAEEHGAVEIELPNRDGAVALAEVLGVLPGEDRLETPEDARLAVCSALDEDAVGRKGYSDRDPTCPGEDGPDRVSL